ncbi:MAG: hypothetical protein HYV13_04340 [Candidatus Doudnabacteria bacterium]|nr:hypothetical protein [Candidatus Doudnabacteria bacterium]
MDPKEMGFYINNLWNAFTLADSKEEVRELFKDLFTHTEYKMLAKRLEIARRLLEGESYESIKENLKVTEKPIAFMSNTLANSGDGIKNAHTKLKLLDKDFQIKRERRQAQLERRERKKMPGETFLADLALEGGSALLGAVQKKLKKASVKKQLPV